MAVSLCASSLRGEKRNKTHRFTMVVLAVFVALFCTSFFSSSVAQDDSQLVIGVKFLSKLRSKIYRCKNISTAVQRVVDKKIYSLYSNEAHLEKTAAIIGPDDASMINLPSSLPEDLGSRVELETFVTKLLRMVKELPESMFRPGIKEKLLLIVRIFSSSVSKTSRAVLDQIEDENSFDEMPSIFDVSAVQDFVAEKPAAGKVLLSKESFDYIAHVELAEKFDALIASGNYSEEEQESMSRYRAIVQKELSSFEALKRDFPLELLSQMRNTREAQAFAYLFKARHYQRRAKMTKDENVRKYYSHLCKIRLISRSLNRVEEAEPEMPFDEMTYFVEKEIANLQSAFKNVRFTLSNASSMILEDLISNPEAQHVEHETCTNIGVDLLFEYLDRDERNKRLQNPEDTSSYYVPEEYIVVDLPKIDGIADQSLDASLKELKTLEIEKDCSRQEAKDLSEDTKTNEGYNKVEEDSAVGQFVDDAPEFQEEPNHIETFKEKSNDGKNRFPKLRNLFKEKNNKIA